MRGSDSAPVAQLDRVSGYEPEGRAFESLRARHSEKAFRPIFGLAFLLCYGQREKSPFSGESSQDSPCSGHRLAAVLCLAYLEINSE